LAQVEVTVQWLGTLKGRSSRLICTKLRGSRYSPAFKPRLLGRDPLQQFRRRFVPRVLRHQLAARGQIENEAAQAGQASQLLQLIPLSQAVVVTSRSGTGSFRQVGKRRMLSRMEYLSPAWRSSPEFVGSFGHGGR